LARGSLERSLLHRPIAPSLHHTTYLLLLVLSSISGSFLCFMLHHCRFPCLATPRGCYNGDAILCWNGYPGAGYVCEGVWGSPLYRGPYRARFCPHDDLYRQHERVKMVECAYKSVMSRTCFSLLAPRLMAVDVLSFSLSVRVNKPVLMYVSRVMRYTAGYLASTPGSLLRSLCLGTPPLQPLRLGKYA
jgi:hypothetical protein